MCPAANACSSCLRNCFVLHKRKHGGPSLGSAFFKIMFGKNFDNFLEVPPAFVKRIRSKVGRKVFLQDSSGQQWDVSLINKSGSYLFQKGWRNFVQDHGIRMGDLVVFHYCKDSDFLVEVFGRSGCLQHYNLDDATHEAARSSVPLKRSREMPFEQSSRKRYTSDIDLDVVRRQRNVPAVEEPVIVARKAPKERQAHEWSPKIVEDEPVIMARKAPTERQVRERSPNIVVEPSFTSYQGGNRPKVVPVTVAEPWFTAGRDQNRHKAFPDVVSLAEPCFIPTREKNVASEHGRECLFDLSAFEMPSLKSTTMDVGEEKEPREAELRRRDDNPITSSSPTVDLPTDPIVPLKIVDEPETSKLSAVSAEEVSLNIWEKKVNVEGESSLGAGISTSVQNDGDIGGTQIHTRDSKDESRRLTNQEPKELQDIHGAMADFSFGCISTSNEQANISGEKSAFSGEINPTLKIEADVHPFVKLEPVDYDAPSENSAKMTCPVPQGAEDFLVLPGPLPLTVRVDRRHTRPKQLLVLLRDSSGRIWPLIYHNKSGVKVLTSGWKEFMKANDIQPGDECIFAVENSEEASLNVQVVRRN